MIINRHNYETYFLLYADNELPASERMAVEKFVAENIDLTTEFELCKATVLPKEEMIFANKALLFKTSTAIPKQVQENLLLKLDNELNKDELVQIEALLKKDLATQKAYNILKQAQLSPADNIVFEHKNLLYKKEKGKIVTMVWLRWAAAAVFIGLLFFINNSNKSFTSTDSVNTIVDKTKNQNIILPKNGNNADTAVQSTNNNFAKANDQNTLLNNNTANNINTAANANLATQQAMPKVTDSKNIANKNDEVAKQKERLHNTVVKDTAAIVVKLQLPKTTSSTNNNTIVNNDEKAIATNKNVKHIVEPIEILDNGYGFALTETNVSKNENTILYMDEDDVKKTKVGAFFKKLKRIVQRTAHLKETSNISIAGF